MVPNIGSACPAFQFANGTLGKYLPTLPGWMSARAMWSGCSITRNSCSCSRVSPPMFTFTF